MAAEFVVTPKMALDAFELFVQLLAILLSLAVLLAEAWKRWMERNGSPELRSLNSTLAKMQASHDKLLNALIERIR